MNYKNIPSIIALLIMIPFLSFGQSVAFNKYNFPQHKKELSDALDHVKSGDKFYSQGPGMYAFALDHYMNANHFNTNNELI